MLRLRTMCRWGVLAMAAGLTMANGPVVTGQGQREQDTTTNQPQQAWAHEPRAEHRTYYDTPEDERMRVLTDDGEYEKDLFERAKRAKEELAKQMSPAQIAEAERLARAAMPPGRK